MLDQQQRIDHDDRPGSPFGRPAFVAAAVLVLVIVLLGVIVAVRISRSSDPVAPPTTAPTSSQDPTTPPPSADPAASVCGLPKPTGNEELSQGLPAAWQYEGTTAYPTSPEFGPARTSDEGYRYCFQPSSAGAVFATANALAVPEDSATRQAWLEYFVSSGSNRARLLEELGSEPSSDPTGIRVRTIGFKVLAYSGSTARVDIAAEATGGAQVVTGSYVYELVWQDGDWKLNSDAPTPFNFSTVSGTAGYIPWNA